MQFLRWLPALALTWIALGLFSSPSNPGRPLWPGSRYTDRDRDTAIRRGLRVIYTAATDARNFEEGGEDYLWCFCCIASTSSDRELRSLSLRMGQERAQQWRVDHPTVPPDASADDVRYLVFGSYAADCLSVRDGKMRQALIDAAPRYRPEEYLEFDPTREPPPGDIPERCAKCGRYNKRGVRVCEKCGSRLTMRSPYSVLLEALTITYSGDSAGVRLGASLPDVTQWLPKMRPYRGRDGGTNRDWQDVVYAITHVIYTLNGYSLFRLRPEWLPDEFEFLRANLKEAIDANDPEAAGEFLDTLKSFGLTEADPLMRSGIEFLLSRQNPDGSWGDPKAYDIFDRYHPTWTAIDGLRDYAWRGEGVTSIEALRRAQGHPLISAAR
jgi:hypothetical protein